MKKTLRVVHYLRKPGPGCYSIERLFADIRKAMPADIDVVVRESCFPSRGLWRRLFNIIEAACHQGEVNHVTGDVHFLTYLLNPRRTVLTVHDCASLERLHGIRRWLLWLFWYWLPLRRAAAITVISESSRQELLRNVDCDPANIYVVYNCVSEWFTPCQTDFNSDYPRILHIGTTPNKNLERVAAALDGVKCHWVIIGYLSKAQRLAIETHGIDYENLSGLDDQALLDQYRLADMLVFASTYEGFGLPIVEANAVGLPVVASNLYSMPEVVGEAACLVDPYDVASIRAGILRVIEDADYRSHLVQAGFRNAERFRPAAIAEQYASLYRSVVAKCAN